MEPAPGERRRPDQARDRGSRQAAPGRVGRDRRRAERRRRSLLPSRRDLRHGGRRGAQSDRQRRRDAARGRAGERGWRRLLSPHLLGRSRRSLPGPVPGGHVRRGPEARPPLFPDEVRVREDRAHTNRGAVARVPAGDRRRRLPDRRDGQDRRSLLLLHRDQAGQALPARLVSADRSGVRVHEHRAGRLRRRRDGSHRASARARRPGLPPVQPEAPALR